MKIRSLLVGAALLVCPVAAHAQVLNFEGIDTNNNTLDFPLILGFYNGGFSSVGTQGPNYGITFSSNADVLCMNTLTNFCSNTSRGGLAPTSQYGALDWEGPNPSGGPTFMTSSLGFTTGFSFFYSAPFIPGGFTVYDGPDGTGNVLANVVLPTTNDGRVSGCNGYSADYCPFSPVGVSFSGTAYSVVFSGTADFIEFDDVTFGSPIPGVPLSTVPEPATMSLMAMGLVGMAGAARRRRKA